MIGIEEPDSHAIFLQCHLQIANWQDWTFLVNLGPPVSLLLYTDLVKPQFVLLYVALGIINDLVLKNEKKKHIKRKKPLVFCTQKEHLWCLGTHLISLVWGESTVLAALKSAGLKNIFTRLLFTRHAPHPSYHFTKKFSQEAGVDYEIFSISPKSFGFTVAVSWSTTEVSGRRFSIFSQNIYIEKTLSWHNFSVTRYVSVTGKRSVFLLIFSL